MNNKKSILILGVMGHIGFNLALLLSKKYRVIGIFNKSKDLNKIKILNLNNIKIIKNDLKKPNLIKKIILKNKIKDCIYTAGVSHDSLAKKNVNKTIEANCLSLNYFLEAQMKRYFDKLIYISTGSVFQDIKQSKQKIYETDKPSPNSIYSITKRLSEILIETFFKKTFKKVSCLRVSWVYGPPLLTKKIVPQRGPLPYIVQKLFIEKKKKLKFKSGGDFAASFTHIDDVCEAISKMITLKNFAHPIYHFGSGKNYSNFDIGNIIKKLYPQKEIVFGKGAKPWSNDSVMRGPLSTKYKFSFLKSKITLRDGIVRYINQVSKK